MIYLLLVLLAAAAYVTCFLYVAHWWIHKRTPA
jgi:hypothetical protein